ncbi:hypothetical protein TBLA_0F01020 [Henningerozyma blattae CBS 6284]|uniref:Uncharacterized protein n=1 Tax=Henningerozyma blattae (strain ATCC 34711 / CBS 6284 / DSM 70876 / NBRC 10599 / NRRL Y-10934 / UCD 77-7) TaxID=1071380 RepID=I2H5J3_HENB6|nr:hypothetical protein TBLA_0F01020 [Tetrapisispora blattae CBS 6284]CCH61645.1 hypothetical protein TBLA_0F01020 [Tetrapisispora blattae CBS 6284]
MDSQNINYLVNFLESSSTIPDDVDTTIINNIIYYTPRLRSLEQLRRFCNAIFNSSIWGLYDQDLVMYQLGEGIISWKLQISEPVISLYNFFKIWDEIFFNCNKWSLSKIAFCSGILSTKEMFIQLQGNQYLDSTGKVIKFYETWKFNTLLPVWNSMLSKVVAEPNLKADILVFLLAMINTNEDISKLHHLPWDLISKSIINQFEYYIFPYNNRINIQLAKCIEKNINILVRMIQISFKFTSISTCDIIEHKIETFSNDFYNQEVETTIGTGRSKKYDLDRNYFNILLIVILTLKGLIQKRISSSASLNNLSFRIINILSNLNFIAYDIGSFETYDYVFDFACYEITRIDNGLSQHIVRDKYWLFMKILSNQCNLTKIKNTKNISKLELSRIKFFINFLKKTIFNCGVSNLINRFVETDIFHKLANIYLSFKELGIADTSHELMILILTISPLDFKIYEKFLVQYVSTIIAQLMGNELSSLQYLEISRKLSSDYKFQTKLSEERSNLISYTILNEIKKIHLLEESALHKKNTNGSDTPLSSMFALFDSLIYSLQLSRINSFLHWIPIIEELYSDGLFALHREETLRLLGSRIIDSRQEYALKWWYDKNTSLQKQLQ